MQRVTFNFNLVGLGVGSGTVGTSRHNYTPTTQYKLSDTAQIPNPRIYADPKG